MYTRYAEFLSSEEATVKTAREFWKELDWKEMEKGSLVGGGGCGTAGGVCVVDCWWCVCGGLHVSFLLCCALLET